MFDALDNFRDFGGYAAAGGLRLKTGRLYRSAHHGALTDADLARLSTYSISAIVDLRRTEERRRTPSRRWGGFGGEVIESDIDAATDDPWLDFIMRSDVLTPQSMRGHMISYYDTAPLEPRHLDLFGRYFAALEHTPGAVLIHCAAGKDRTGLLAALTHHLAGVSADDILHDYLLTNTLIDMVGRAPKIAQSVAKRTGREISDAAMVAGLVVEADHLRTGLAAMTRAYGSVDAYLEHGLGVTPRRKAAILARLLD